MRSAMDMCTCVDNKQFFCSKTRNNLLTHLGQKEFNVLINWSGTFQFYGLMGGSLYFILIFIDYSASK